MTTTINASPSNGLVQTADGSGILKVQSNGVTTNALAWATVTGSTGAVLASYNISSVTRNSTGAYTAAFTSALSDNNYVAVGGASVQGSTVTAGTPVTFGDKAGAYGVRSTTQLQVFTYSASVGAWTDPSQVSFAIFGN